jgi:hypothetical protein
VSSILPTHPTIHHIHYPGYPQGLELRLNSTESSIMELLRSRRYLWAMEGDMDTKSFKYDLHDLLSDMPEALSLEQIKLIAKK